MRRVLTTAACLVVMSGVLLAQITASTPENATHPKRRERATRMHRVTLSWRPSGNGLTSGDIVGYNVYRCSALSSDCTQINTAPVAVREYVDDQVRSGHTYYYATTSVNQDGKQSRISNVVKVEVPFP